MSAEVEELTKFKFEQLSSEAQEKAVDSNRDWDVYDNWWDYTYEDAVRMGALMGIAISTSTRTSARNCKYKETNISFSGFSSQGDGASWTGRYDFKPDAIEAIEAECSDDELIRIATELTELQTKTLFCDQASFSAVVTTSGRYSHSGTMDIEVSYVDAKDDCVDVDNDAEKAITQLMRDFADWIYSSLEAEHDHLTSDEHIRERLTKSDHLFDEDGSMI